MKAIANYESLERRQFDNLVVRFFYIPHCPRFYPFFKGDHYLNHFPQSNFCLSDQDVEQYLASKENEEVIGICTMPSSCLIARAVKAKYPDVAVDVYNSTIFISTATQVAQLSLTPRQQQMVECFDYGTKAHFQEPVTKADFLAAWHRFPDKNARSCAPTPERAL